MDAARIIPQLQSTDRWQAIDELITLLVATGQIDSTQRPAIQDAINQRENSRSTGIGSGIAIPHARTPLVSTLVWAFGRSKDGIDFAAYDNQPARFLLLFLVPDNAYQQNLQTLAGLARFFRGDQVLRDLATAPDAAAILNIIRGGLN